jgi:hypothetical protein
MLSHRYVTDFIDLDKLLFSQDQAVYDLPRES